MTYIDEFVDDLLTKPRVCGTTLPHLSKRIVLEDQDRLEPRESPLGEELDELDSEDRPDERSGGSSVEGANGMANGNKYSSDGEMKSDDEMG